LNQENTQARVALVTGAGRRIGAVIAETLHNNGFSVVIHCHCSQSEAKSLCAEFNKKRPNSARVFSANLTQKKENQKLITEVVDWGGRLDLLVNNASIFMKTPLESLDDVRWEALFSINVQAPFWLSFAARNFLAAQQGSIVNITDIHAETPLKGYAEYCQTKAALTMQTKALALEFAPSVRVNAIAPGAIAWPELTNELTHEQQEKIIEKTLLKRHGDAVFIAQAVLAVAENPFITGQTIRVDGGRLLS